MLLLFRGGQFFIGRQYVEDRDNPERKGSTSAYYSMIFIRYASRSRWKYRLRPHHLSGPRRDPV